MMDALAEPIEAGQAKTISQALRVRPPKSRRKVLILGGGEFARTCWEMLSQYPRMADRVIGFAVNCEQSKAKRGVVGSFSELFDLVERYRVGMVVVCLEDRRDTLPINMLLGLKVAGVEVIDGHRLVEELTGRLLIDSLKPSTLIFSRGFKRPLMTMLIKRAVDIGIASFGLIVTAPCMLMVACLIKLDSPGPVFYRQERVGLAARPFVIIKFRTMVDRAEASGPQWAHEGDPRISRVGRWLRKWRIDEIPQFINVLKGEMSIVGPRPERPVFVEELRKVIPYYDIRHSVRPGMTGWAQVMFGYASSKEDSHLKLQYDLYYVKNLSFWLDLKTIIKTFRVLAMGEGAR